MKYKFIVEDKNGYRLKLEPVFDNNQEKFEYMEYLMSRGYKIISAEVGK